MVSEKLASDVYSDYFVFTSTEESNFWSVII